MLIFGPWAAPGLCEGRDVSTAPWECPGLAVPPSPASFQAWDPSRHPTDHLKARIPGPRQN